MKSSYLCVSVSGVSIPGILANLSVQLPVRIVGLRIGIDLFNQAQARRSAIFNLFLSNLFLKSLSQESFCLKMLQAPYWDGYRLAIGLLQGAYIITWLTIYRFSRCTQQTGSYQRKSLP